MKMWVRCDMHLEQAMATKPSPAELRRRRQTLAVSLTLCEAP
jgi:hypothetical protein